MNKFWNLSNDVLAIDGPIESDCGFWFDDEITPRSFREDLDQLGGDVRVRINSPGGDVFAAADIYAALKEHKKKCGGTITVEITGMAASAASLVAMAGDKVLMSPMAVIMIHNPWTMAQGNANELRGLADVLDTVRESMLAAYVRKTGLDEETLKQLLDEETYMTMKQAIEMGFCDGELEYTQTVAAALRECGSGEKIREAADNMAILLDCDMNAIRSERDRRHLEQMETERMRAWLRLQIALS